MKQSILNAAHTARTGVIAGARAIASAPRVLVARVRSHKAGPDDKTGMSSVERCKNVTRLGHIDVQQGTVRPFASMAKAAAYVQEMSGCPLIIIATNPSDLSYKEGVAAFVARSA